MLVAAPESPFDVLVVGAGFGGLGAALSLAEQGARVCLCETLKYPGGCASTFQRNGFRFDAGATLVSGLAKGQLFGAWLARYAPELPIEWLDSMVELRAPNLTLCAMSRRAALVEQLASFPGADSRRLLAFFERQERVADVLWPLFDDPTLLPPFDLKMLARHAARSGRYLALMPLLGRSLGDVLGSHGLEQFAPLRLYADALCQITVQCSASEAEAPFALTAMDYYYRGTAHVRGGVGALASALCAATARAGGDVRLANRVTSLFRGTDGLWVARTRRGEVRARAIIANVLPSALAELLGPEHRSYQPLAERGALIEDAWGAAMLYAVARTPAGSPESAHHLQLVQNTELPLIEGNHVFVSISSASEHERAPPGRRTLTMSSHVPLSRLRASGDGAGRYVANVQSRMRRTLQARAPEWSDGIEFLMTASPRTFARFVGRPAGAVGGLPRYAGLSSYAGLGPSEAAPRLWLVGDSVFPGQSALATAIGGVRTAVAVRRSLG